MSLFFVPFTIKIMHRAMLVLQMLAMVENVKENYNNLKVITEKLQVTHCYSATQFRATATVQCYAVQH
jgi:hypothetical protein